MELKEMKEFFEEYEKIPYEEKREALSYMVGIVALSGKWEIINDLLYSERDFDEVFSELEETVQEEDSLDTEKTFKKLFDYKDVLKKSHTFYKCKKQVSDLASPFSYLSMASSQPNGSFGFLLSTMVALSDWSICRGKKE